MERLFLCLAGLAAIVLFSAARVDSDDTTVATPTTEQAPSAKPAARNLWVTLERGGELHRVAVTRGEAVSYVKSYVAGREAAAIPDRFLTEWLKSKAGRRGAARIMRAEECSGSDSNSCVRLRGIYAGRSPDEI